MNQATGKESAIRVGGQKREETSRELVQLNTIRTFG
jgi:hypothetical protein